MPDAFEFPGMRRAVVPLVRAGDAVIDEVVAFALGRAVGSCRRLAGRRAGLLPGFAAVVRALNDLPEPTAGLGCIQPVCVNGRAFDVVQLPTGKGAGDRRPPLAFAVGRENKRALFCANQNSDLAHVLLLLMGVGTWLTWDIGTLHTRVDRVGRCDIYSQEDDGRPVRFDVFWQGRAQLRSKTFRDRRRRIGNNRPINARLYSDEWLSKKKPFLPCTMAMAPIMITIQRRRRKAAGSRRSSPARRRTRRL